MFQVGQKVVCIKDEDAFAPWNWPKKGEIYTIRAIGECTPAQTYWWGKNVVVWVNEVVNSPDASGQEPGFGQGRFRPLVERKTDISIFEKLLNPANHKHLEGV